MSSDYDEDARREENRKRILNELLTIMVRRFEELVSKGFLSPQFLHRIASDPSEILKFLRQNRSVVGDQLSRRLDPSIRPTPSQLESKGIVPIGYFSHGYDVAIAKQHRRRSTTHQDLSLMLELRPKNAEDIIKKGVVSRSEMLENNYYELDEYHELDGGIGGDLSDGPNDNTNNTEIYEISIVNSLLFSTIREALSKCSLDTKSEEIAVLQEMQAMNEEMSNLRAELDKYFMSFEPNIELFKNEEDMVRGKFVAIQKSLLHISSRQMRIADKLLILKSVEKSMIDLENNYDIEMSKLHLKEGRLLSVLNSKKIEKLRAQKIQNCEFTHQNWAMAKLDYTIELAKRMGDASDVHDLQEFLNTLQGVYEHQTSIVAEFDHLIESNEAELMAIRHKQSHIRTLTFSKIYDLHKQVLLAETLELGNRRLSVASATEIEKERRHHFTKIQRQLKTLNSQVQQFDYDNKGSLDDVKQMVYIRTVFSDAKLKSFFTVFTQTSMLCLCDVELCNRNLNCDIPSNDNSRVGVICSHLYGIQSVINACDISDNNESLSLNEKLKKCLKFIRVLKNAIGGGVDDGVNEEVISTHRCNGIIVRIANELCANENISDEIARCHHNSIPRLAQIRCKDIFQAVIQGHTIFDKKHKPKSIKEAANAILKNVFGINCT